MWGQMRTQGACEVGSGGGGSGCVGGYAVHALVGRVYTWALGVG